MEQKDLIARFAEVANDPNAYVIDWKNVPGGRHLV